MNLTKLTNQVTSQILVDDRITKQIAKPLFNKINNVGITSVLAVTAFFATDLARADSSLNTTLGLSALVGLLNNGSRPSDVPNDCNIKGTNGYIVGGAGAAGAYAMNQIGGGKGKKILTVAGGFLAATAAQNIENNRIRNECFKNQSQKVNYPRANQPNNMPQQMVLYATESNQGYVAYVHADNSPGIASMQGQRGGQDIYSNPELQRDMENSMTAMIRSYQILDSQSNNYLHVSNGRNISNNQYFSRNNLDQENSRLQQALSDYSRERAFFAQKADNATVNGYNLNNFSQALNYMSPPSSIEVVYGGRVNRFSTLKTTYANR